MRRRTQEAIAERAAKDAVMAKENAIAVLLGWTDIQPDMAYDHWVEALVPEWYTGFPPEGEYRRAVPHFYSRLNVSVATIHDIDPLLQIVLRWNVYEQKPECELVKQGLGLGDSVRIPAFAYGETIEEATAECLMMLLRAKTQQK